MQHLSAQQQASLADLGENVVYLMGLSFMLGSLFTIFILLMLELVRHKRNA